MTRTSEMDGMLEVIVPEGEFQMGDDIPYTQPVHTVWLDAYWIDKTDVTNAMFKKFVNATGYKTDVENAGSSNVVNDKDKTIGGAGLVRGATWKYPQGPNFKPSGNDDHPVVQVSWNDAKAYCDWAGRRLPTEAEWEKAARGTDGRMYPWGNQAPSRDFLNFYKNVDASTPVGSYPAGASPYGALDMAGNVFQLVLDWFNENYYSSQTEWRNPQGPASGDRHFSKGSSWATVDVKYLVSADRYDWYPDSSSNLIGFRCAEDAQK
jgi:eukaryotic-like serine/threonine-protein kinase